MQEVVVLTISFEEQVVASGVQAELRLVQMGGGDVQWVGRCITPQQCALNSLGPYTVTATDGRTGIILFDDSTGSSFWFDGNFE